MAKVNREWTVLHHGPIERLEDAPELVRVIVSHHRPITDRPAETLRRVAAAL